MPDPFEAIASSYGNIISEAKGRLMIVERALSRNKPAEVLEYVAVSDLCALQFRKTFEAIALACLAMHGDLLPESKPLRKDTYRADKLLKALARLHPDFYPRPCTVRGKLHRGERGGVTDIESGWLTKDELQSLYYKLDHQMHVGTLSRREITAVAIDWEDLRSIYLETAMLIRTHWIILPNGRRLICDTTSEKPVIIEVLRPPE